MAYDQKKLQAFEQAIREETDQKIAVLEQEARQYEETELQKAKQEEKARMDRCKAEQAQAVALKYRRQVTRARLDRRRSLLTARNRMVEEVFLEAARALAAFAASPEYPAHLERSVEAALREFPCEEAVLTLPEKLLPLGEALREKFSAITEVRADPQNLLGGFCLLNEANGLLLDETFETLLEEHRQPFLASCGLKVTF